ncbi:zinc-binding alcohol dehydrogenase family protein [Xenococcus sp. PCC 7305]|uniref:zinc-binding alcohol dehydrogenase family protein n=1 Tax=Xenococcus sp. PCC 7305 TaxID=102125 RepID=UPI0002AC473C|nr:zinc-binding alcohol dehydrogenase family protein [Xenococcus sp. PCC 7305]ELS01772.1 zinc-binding alcohol dehydrogenase family protein [Xenococcus sp. PCC 7305]
MKAVGLTQYLPIDDENSLLDVEIPKPIPKGKDLLVQIKALSVNPVDTKVRTPQDKVESEPRILGWDAAGIVVEVGAEVTEFKPEDEVYYAGDITRPGSNSEFQLIDERIVGRKPQNLDFAQAAALPLTSITAWEALFERLNIDKTGADAGKSILIINGAGGVGSVAIQLAKKLAKLNVIATASRPETIAWCQNLGADQVVNHRNNLADEIEKIGYQNVDYILCLNDTDGHWQAMTNAIAPQGKICSIVENQQPLDMNILKSKSASFVWEFMFTRSMYQTADMAEQSNLLNELSQLIENGVIISTCNDVIKPINAKNLRDVHQRLEKGRTIGKIVLAEWN